MKAAVVLPKRLIYQSDLASVPENRTIVLISALSCDVLQWGGPADLSVDATIVR